MNIKGTECVYCPNEATGHIQLRLWAGEHLCQDFMRLAVCPTHARLSVPGEPIQIEVDEFCPWDADYEG